MKKFLALYFNGGCLPALVFLILLGGFTVTATVTVPPSWRYLTMVMDTTLFVVGCATGVAFLGLTSAAIWDLVKKRWNNVLFMLACGVVTVFACSFLWGVSMSRPDKYFTDDDLVEIPADLDIAEPSKSLSAQPGGEQDAFQNALLTALQSPGGQDATVQGNIAALMQLQQNNPEVLRRYLASSPAWRVFREGHAVFATRRWKIGSEWQYDGSYSRHDIDRWSESGIPDFQSNVTIGLSAEPSYDGKKVTWLNAGETAQATLSTDNQMLASYCVISGGSVIVEVFEQSGAPERRLTKAALDFLQTEMEALAKNPSWETIRALLPADSIMAGEPSLNLRNSSQPGIYDSVIRVNPGEPGMLYLKAFEVTKGTPLSVDSLEGESNEWVGWSDNPKEVFFSNTNFTIGERYGGEPYAARFEVWFVPDSGGQEGKLMEKVFKIKGWLR